MQRPDNGNLSLPPGPKGRRIRNLIRRTRDFRGLMKRFHEEYGKIVYYRVPGVDFCAVFDADLIRELLVEKADVFPNYSYIGKDGSAVIGTPGMIRDHGEHHLRAREVFGGAFVASRTPFYADIVAENVLEMRERWCHGQLIDYKEEVVRFTCAAFLDALLGRSPRIPPNLPRDAETAIKREWALGFLPGSSLLKRLPLPANVRTRRVIQALDDAVYGAIRRARDRSYGGEEVACHAVRAAHSHDRCPYSSDVEIRDEIYMMVPGSIAPPINSLINTLELLDKHPAVRERLEREVDEVLGDREITGADFDRLPYAQAVFKESVRLRPPSYGGTSHWRQASEDSIIGGYRIPKGTIAHACHGVSQRDPAYWERAAEFWPERWLDESRQSHPDHAYIPFGAGPHTCLGLEFGTVLVVLALAGCVQGMRLELVSPTPFKVEVVGIEVKGPIQVRVHERMSGT